MLALVGWYLVVSPTDQPNARITDWQIVKGFDHAAECEEYRSQGAEGGHWNLSGPFGSQKNDPPEIKQKPVSLCIASDDPRLAK
jgi:hypothetical protein